MIEANELRPGLLVIWKRESFAFSMDFWFSRDIPCVITEVNEKTFRVMRFDDFTETEPMEMFDVEGKSWSSRRDMRACSEAEIRDYLSDRVFLMQERVENARKRIESMERELEEYEKKTTKYKERVESVFEEIKGFAK